MAAENEVRRASARFYEAINQMANGDAGPMLEVWAHDGNVTTMHPIGGREIGWGAVRKSFEQVAQLASDGQVILKDQFIHVAGEVAYEMGVERGHAKFLGQIVDFEQRVTNIYQRQGGEWKLIHHHTDISPAMLEVVSRLQLAQTEKGR